MTERGMIFNAEMVRAVLDGSKTQTRQIIQERHLYRGRGPGNWPAHMPTGQEGEQAIQWLTENSPFGAVGDRLWVRETWNKYGGLLTYRADHDWINEMRKATVCLAKWTPSIHMPRWASRITLEITGVRVEQLNSISEEDAAAEGVGSAVWFAGKGVPEEQWTSLGEHGAYRASHINSFATLWESIYGADSWQANPWVWVIEFKRVEDGSHE